MKNIFYGLLFSFSLTYIKIEKKFVNCDGLFIGLFVVFVVFFVFLFISQD